VAELTEQNERLLGREEIASYMQVSQATLDRWCRRRENRPPVAKIGRTVYAFRWELDAWVSRQAKECEE